MVSDDVSDEVVERGEEVVLLALPVVDTRVSGE